MSYSLLSVKKITIDREAAYISGTSTTTIKKRNMEFLSEKRTLRAEDSDRKQPALQQITRGMC